MSEAPKPAEQTAGAEPGLLTIVLQPEFSSRGLNIRISPDQRDQLAHELQMVELPVRYGIEESAAQVLEIVATFTGPIAAGVGARALPKEAWTALGTAVTALINKNPGRRVELHYGDGKKLVVENDRRAVRETVRGVLPVVREQMVNQQDQWDQRPRELDNDRTVRPDEPDERA